MALGSSSFASFIRLDLNSSALKITSALIIKAKKGVDIGLGDVRLE